MPAHAAEVVEVGARTARQFEARVAGELAGELAIDFARPGLVVERVGDALGPAQLVGGLGEMLAALGVPLLQRLGGQGEALQAVDELDALISVGAGRRRGERGA